MDLDELIRNVKKMDILSKGITQQRFSGNNNSIFKGRGITFDSIRKYEVGDDVRSLNWNVTARFREAFVNTFQEDKVRKIWLLIDVSGSSAFGTVKRRKIDLEIEIAATLAYNAIQKNDSVGVIFFSSKIEQVIMPLRGINGFWHIAKAMVKSTPCAGATDLSGALRFLMKLNPAGNIVFVISDFMTENYEHALKVISQNNEVLAIHVFDKLEYALPKIGWVKLNDIETGSQKWMNTSKQVFVTNYKRAGEKERGHQLQMLQKKGISNISVATDEDIIEKLIMLMR